MILGKVVMHPPQVDKVHHSMVPQPVETFNEGNHYTQTKSTIKLKEYILWSEKNLTQFANRDHFNS